MEEDKDANCRLRHGLNVHCLAHIFQYLATPDLYIVGEMNQFYKQIINDLVIPKHDTNIYNLFKRAITIAQVFERYGPKIRKINFVIDFNETHTVEQLVQSITQYCLPDQLKSADIYCDTLNDVVHLPNQFRNVERFEFHGNEQLQLSVQFSGTLRFLSLTGFALDPNFNWKILRNLTELYLNDVQGINVQHFIEFLRLRPKLRAFHHDRDTFDDSTETICEAMAKYCGNQIQDYRGEMPYGQKDMYSFISGFKNVKKVHFTSNQICGGNLIDPMKRLAENDTVEELAILYTKHANMSCIFQERPTLESFGMRQFSHLKTIHILGLWDNFEAHQHAKVCIPFKVLDMFGTQIFSNVENLMVDMCTTQKVQDFIKFSPKLRHLKLCVSSATSKQAAEILSILEKILQGRKNERVNDDIIEIKFTERYVFREFAKIDGRSESIKLTMDRTYYLL